jgi:hypothetical protein
MKYFEDSLNSVATSREVIQGFPATAATIIYLWAVFVQAVGEVYSKVL